MRLAKEGLLEHIDAPKAPEVGSSAIWKMEDMKAFAIVYTTISPSFYSLVRTAQSTAQAWKFSKTFFLRQSIHNRVQMQRQLHEFKMQNGGNMMDHFLKFDEICMSMQAIGDEVSQKKQLVILLGSLSEESDQIANIIENMQGINLFQAKEMLHREFESMMRKETSEIALKAITKSRKSRVERKGRKFEGKCFACSRFGHKKEDCWKNQKVKEERKEQAFTVCDSMEGGWLLDSGASSHMCPYEEEFNDIRPLEKSIPIMIANGKQVAARGIGTIRVVLKNKKPIRIYNVLFVPELDRRLLSIPVLVERGLNVSFENGSCANRNNQEIVTEVARKGKLYVMESVTREEVYAVEEKQMSVQQR